MDIAAVMDDLATALTYVAESSSFSGTVRYNWNSGTVAGWTGDSATATNVANKLRLSASLGSGSVNMRKDDSGTVSGGTTPTGNVLQMELTPVALPAGTWTAKIQWQNGSFSYIEPTSVTMTRIDTGAVVTSLTVGQPVYVTCTFASIASPPNAFAIEVDGTGATAGTVTVDIDNFSQGSVIDTPAVGIDGLRVHPYYLRNVTAPAAIVHLPESYEFDDTFGRGTDKTVFPVTVVVGNSEARSSRDDLAKYLAGSGDHSVKQAVESFTATTYDSARVTSCDIGTVTIAAVTYLAATFDIEIYGPGSGS